MKVNVKNLGAIKHASIDLNKKLSVFCGPNGTGKTYLAYLIYAITNLGNKNMGYLLDKEHINSIASTNQSKINIDIDRLWGYRSILMKIILANLGKLFAVAENKRSEFFSKTEINLSDTREEFGIKIQDLSFEKELKIYGYKFRLIKENGKNEIEVIFDKNQIKDQAFLRYLEIELLSQIYSVLSFYPIVSSTIFPVERNSIYTFSKELSISNNDRFEIIKESPNYPNKLIFKPNLRYPQPIRDGLRVAEDLENIQKLSSQFYDFAVEIETELLNGKVIISNNGSVEFSSNKAPTIKLSFHQSSSIVKTLSSLVIYLKHIAIKDDLLIIDEPELNLHPENQIKLARIFARLINKGIRLIISTHSDYIIRELNNLIMVSSLKKYQSENNIASELEYKEDEFIELEDFAAYLFNYKNEKSKQTEVKTIECNELGFEVLTIDQTIENLNDRSEKLYYSLIYKNEND